MAKQPIPTVASPRATHYKELLGVDFREDQTEVSARRSPDMVNMISDMGGNPIKRSGYRRILEGVSFIVNANNRAITVEKSGTSVYFYELTFENAMCLKTLVGSVDTYVAEASIKSAMGVRDFVIVFGDCYWLKFDVVDKTFEITGIKNNAVSVGEIGSSEPRCSDIIPTTVIGLKPDGTNGTSYYGKSILTPYQTFMYQGDGTSKTYKIPFYKYAGQWAKAEVMNENGEWVSVSISPLVEAAPAVYIKGVDGAVTTNKAAKAEIVFDTAPPTPTSAGEDNVRITIAPFNDSEGYYSEPLTSLINSNTHFFYEARLIVAAKERTYYSEVNRLFDISDNAWFDVDSSVVAYQRASNYLAVITSDTGSNTIFLAVPQNDSSTGAVQFSVKASNAGVGAVSGKVLGVLNDEPVVLSFNGLYGILTNWTSEKYTVNRSGRANKRLCKEPNLQSAVGVPFNQYYYLAVNGKMYVFDSRHKDNSRTGETSYETYYFENLPLIEWAAVLNNRMYFGENGNVYVWNDDLKDSKRYYDNSVQTFENGEYVINDGEPVRAKWCSKYDDDGHPQMLKTLNKKGSMVIFLPQLKSGGEITLIKDGDEYQRLGYSTANICNFEFVNFETPNFNFSSNDIAYDRFTKKKIKKYKRLQIVVENNYPEPFGLVEVVKSYTIGNYAKR